MTRVHLHARLMNTEGVLHSQHICLYGGFLYFSTNMPFRLSGAFDNSDVSNDLSASFGSTTKFNLS